MFSISKTDQTKYALMKIKNLQFVTAQGVRRALYLAGKDMVKTSRAMMMEPKSGKPILVRMGRTGKLKNSRLHIQSAPGEAPAIITGTLKKSVDFNVVGTNKIEFGAKDSVSYGGFLEDGTSKMEKRPYLKPSIEKNEKNLYNKLNDSVKKSLEGKT